MASQTSVMQQSKSQNDTSAKKKLQKAKSALTKARKLAKLGKKKVSDLTETLGQHPHHVGMEMSTIEEDRKVPPDIHHFISSNKNHPVHLSEFLHSDEHEDPAKKDFYKKLKEHLLGRFLERNFDGDTHESFTDDQRKSIILYDNKMFATKNSAHQLYNVRCTSGSRCYQSSH
ncbi:hypothetical protein BT96DRAFT_1003961 [Gymnopus androsaceus JB14]|uniref:Uncharacterized protein n=1 Tax=Gymnopus androsaceus JB14 TaxID=1447944 RepID=A0A6A4GSL1_9AGAR|nr:hypothetical protein BT96DRAFT_1003961 [Gymnopus androsaceus JB14]